MQLMSTEGETAAKAQRAAAKRVTPKKKEETELVKPAKKRVKLNDDPKEKKSCESPMKKQVEEMLSK